MRGSYGETGSGWTRRDLSRPSWDSTETAHNNVLAIVLLDDSGARSDVKCEIPSTDLRPTVLSMGSGFIGGQHCFLGNLTGDRSYVPGQSRFEGFEGWRGRRLAAWYCTVDDAGQ
jgi:hypothetical protein